MLLSMTGQGQGRRQYGSAEITAEVRAVNNRHLKVHLRTGEGLSNLEPQIETLVRQSLRRGSLQLAVQLTGFSLESEYHLQSEVVEGYLQQCRDLAKKLGVESTVGIGELLNLPGVVAEPRSGLSDTKPDDELVGKVLETVTEALECLNRMRQTEGQSMADELLRQLERLDGLAALIEERAPIVVEEYQTRLETRLAKALAEVGTQLQETDLVREVLIMADKSDIREEIVRLRSHLDQFRKLLAAENSQGRKLDFLIQEMFRETNTIGSKANDAEIAQRVVDVKTIIEQMRELVQNVE